MSVDGNALLGKIIQDLSNQGLYPVTAEFGLSPRQVASKLLVDNILKKFPDNVDPAADQKALDKFLQVNKACENWTLSEERSLVEDVILGEVRDALHKFWFRKGSFNPEEGWASLTETGLVENPYYLLTRGRLGPGASLMAAGGDFYSKLFAGTLTCTKPVLYAMYRHYVSKLPLWRDAEERRAQDCEVVVVDYNRISFVPKDNTISRTICTEPSLNMFYQLGLATFLEERLRVWGINLESQPFLNRKMALRGSRDGSFATIDLSSASDSMSLKMLRCMLPKEWYELLLLLRADYTELPDETKVPLHMVSTMGNGFTFPLQTILFSAVVRSVYKVMGIKPVDGELGRTWSVFGDDIIVVAKAFTTVCRVLNLLGFCVNEKKSFKDGDFKESCGLDAYQGVDVRAVYLKKVNKQVTHYVIFNRLLGWASAHSVELPNTFGYLLSLGRCLRVPLWENDDAGFKTPLDLCGQISRNANGSFQYRKMSADPPVLRFVDGFVKLPKGRRARFYNPAGHFLSALHGCCTKDAISLRPSQDEAVRYRQRTAVAPNWGRWLHRSPEMAIDEAWLTTTLAPDLIV
jgi:hypothetical protein